MVRTPKGVGYIWGIDSDGTVLVDFGFQELLSFEPEDVEAIGGGYVDEQQEESK